MNPRCCYFARSIVAAAAAAFGVAAGVVAAPSPLLLLLSLPKVTALSTSPTTTNTIRKNSNTAKSFVELYDPKTNTDIVLLGCLHGSLSSSIDVKQILLGEESTGKRKNSVEKSMTTQMCIASSQNRTPLQPNPRDDDPSSATSMLPNAVVLELCEPRYNDLVEMRSEIIEDYDQFDFWQDLIKYWKRTLTKQQPDFGFGQDRVGDDEFGTNQSEWN